MLPESAAECTGPLSPKQAATPLTASARVCRSASPLLAAVKSPPASASSASVYPASASHPGASPSRPGSAGRPVDQRATTVAYQDFPAAGFGSRAAPARTMRPPLEGLELQGRRILSGSTFPLPRSLSDAELQPAYATTGKWRANGFGQPGRGGCHRTSKASNPSLHDGDKRQSALGRNGLQYAVACSRWAAVG